VLSPKPFRLHTHAVEQREPAGGLGRVDAGIDHVPPGLDAAIAAAHYHARHVVCKCAFGSLMLLPYTSME